MTGNRYLSGAFAPVTEEITAYDLPVTGRLPAHLNGRYLRNGPNPLGIEDAATHLRPRSCRTSGARPPAAAGSSRTRREPRTVAATR